MNKISLFIFFYVFPYLLHSQTISGFLKEKDTFEPLIGAQIFINNGFGGTTNEHGYFSLHANPGDTLFFSYVAMQKQQYLITEDTDQKIEILLESAQLENIEIVGYREQKPNVSRLDPMKIRKIPVLFGEADVMKALTLEPGVQFGLEGTSDIFVRGGSQDQNLVLMDGATLYNFNHLYGFQSIFDIRTIKDVTFVKGGGPAKYGGRLSSTIDIRLKEGNRNEHKKEVSIGLINAGWFQEGPLDKGRKHSYLFSARSSYPGILQLFRRYEGKREGGLYSNIIFGDVTGKLTFAMPKNGKLNVTVFLGQDNFIQESTFNRELYKIKNNWGNSMVSASFGRPIAKNIYSLSLVSFNRFHNRIQSSDEHLDHGEKSTIKLRSTVQEFSVKQQLQYSKDQEKIHLGVEANKHWFAPQQFDFSQSADDLAISEVAYEPYSFALYSSYEKRFNRFKVDLGARYVLFMEDKFQYSFEPRVSLEYRFDNANLALTYGRTSQFVHLLTSNDVGLSTDIWVPANVNVPIQRAEQFSLEGTKHFGNKFKLTTAIYYKKLKNQIAYAEGANFSDPVTNAWENSIEKDGIGLAYGGELGIEKQSERIRWSLAYTLAWSFRQFENINAGAWYRFKYDRRHNLSAQMVKKLKNGWELQGTFVLASGARISIPEGLYLAFDKYYFQDENNPKNHTTAEFLTSRNNFGLPVFHRMDVGFQHTRHKTTKGGKAVERIWNLSLYNLYNRKNIYAARFSQGDVAYFEPEPNPFINFYVNTSLEYYTVFGIVPAFSFQLKW